MSDLPQTSMVKTRAAKRVKCPVTLCLGVFYIVESITYNSVCAKGTEFYVSEWDLTILRYGGKSHLLFLAGHAEERPCVSNLAPLLYLELSIKVFFFSHL